MNKKAVLAILVVGIILGIGIHVFADALFNIPQKVTVTSQTLYEAYIDGVQWTDGTEYDWGSLEPDDWIVTLEVKNTGNTPFTVSITVTGLPTGWTQTWDADNTLLNPTESAIGDLNLHIDATATTGEYTWDLTVNIID